MAREVPEWIGKSDDQAIPPRVRLRVFERHGGICHLSGRKIMAGDKWQIDHVKALVNGGEHRESNFAPVLDAPHKAKTAEDVAEKSKVYRIRAKHLGLWPKGQNIQSRPFPGRKAKAASALGRPSLAGSGRDQ